MNFWIVVAALLGANVGFAIGWSLSFASRATTHHAFTLEDAEQ